MGEGDGGAVEELGLQPALLVAAVADGSTCKKKKDMGVIILRCNKASLSSQSACTDQA